MERNENYLLDGFNKYMNNYAFDFAITSEEILAELKHSKENGNAIGIYAASLGDTMYITGVEDILWQEIDPIIVLKPYDTTGYILPISKINLKEIISVCPFKSPIKNPYLENIEKDKNWFF